jgi:hypothetical protein
MQQHYFIELEFGADDFVPIVELVRSLDPIVASPSTIDDRYNLREYIVATTGETASLWALLDNNILTRACALAEGQSAVRPDPNDRSYRIVAAIMCFFILGGFDLEPSVAIYEKSARSDHQKALDALELFRIADHVHPQAYSDLALGRTNCLPPDEIDRAREFASAVRPQQVESDFTRTIKPWQVQYLALLNAAILQANHSDPLTSALAFLEWMENESFFSITGSLFSLAFLSPNRPARMIKDVSKPDPDKVLTGVRNAAWDLTYVSAWGRRARRAAPRELSFLCSNDKIVKTMAKPIFVTNEQDTDEELTQFLRKYWPKDAAAKLLAAMNIHQTRITSDTGERRKLVEARYNEMGAAIERAENALRLAVS